MVAQLFPSPYTLPVKALADQAQPERVAKNGTFGNQDVVGCILTKEPVEKEVNLIFPKKNPTRT